MYTTSLPPRHTPRTRFACACPFRVTKGASPSGDGPPLSPAPPRDRIPYRLREGTVRAGRVGMAWVMCGD